MGGIWEGIVPPASGVSRMVTGRPSSLCILSNVQALMVKAACHGDCAYNGGRK